MLRTWRGVALATMALLAALALAACGSSGSSTSSAVGSGSTEAGAETEAETETTASAGACGSIPVKAPEDPDGVLAGLSKEAREAFNLYPAPVTASAWGNFKPSHPGPYKIALSALETSDPFGEELVSELRAHQGESDLVSEIKLVAANFDVQTQIRQVQQLIRERYDAIIFFQGSAAADAKVEEEAGKAGIPLVGPLQIAENPWMVGIYGNEYLKGAEMMAGLSSLMDGQGSLLKLIGIPGLPSTDGVVEGIDSVLAQCPEIEEVGEIEGQYAASTAKTKTLQFLAAHPAPIDGVVQTGGMATGVIEAFEQTGREVPPLGDNGGTPGALGYWQEKVGTYKGIASVGLQVPVLAEATWATIEALLEGRGVKTNAIAWQPPVIDEENLDEWVEPGTELQTPLIYSKGPAKPPFPSGYLDQFFGKPAQ